MNKSIILYNELVAQINAESAELCSLTSDELRSRLSSIEKHISSCDNKSATLDKYLVQVYAIVKETARRFSLGDIIVQANKYDRFLAANYDFVVIDGETAIFKNKWDVCGNPTVWKMVHYDEQLLGGIFLHYGYATEMATGEGKTLVATLPVFLNALTHEGVHLMTVNEYLSRRDFETTRPIYMFHGLTVDCIENYSRSDARKKKAYQSDITFGTNSNFTFDYLYDHIALTPLECVQTSHNYAIIDELDSILIDDADEPHIIGGGATCNRGELYSENLPIFQELLELESSGYYICDKLKRSASFTKKGKEWLANRKGITDLYDVERVYEVPSFEEISAEEQNAIREKLELQNVFLQLLYAYTLYEKDEDYLVDHGVVKIIDQHTGRVKESSRWEHGLHTAIEVKENVKVQNDFNSMAVISLKNYYRLYNKIAGMSGTIMPVEEELYSTYNLRSVSLPTHKPMIRKDEQLRVFKTSADKDKAIIETIVANHKSGRPTLVGNISLKRSDEICKLLNEHDVPYSKLDAKTIKDESALVAMAGLGNAITISTSVAGRGTDIKPSRDAIDNGGLMVIGTDLFDSIRIDRQLKGRSGRQGDPGSSLFFASLEDRILMNLSSSDIEMLKDKASCYDGVEISHDDIRYYFEKAQKNREDYFRETRMETARKDDIVDPRRKKFYHQRNSVLFSSEAAEAIVYDILHASESSRDDVDANMRLLYQKTKELLIRSERNNANRRNVYVPFSEQMHIYAVLLDIQSAKTSYDYFCNEFKRQIILQIYDCEWGKFVQYMMGNLDKQEIEALDEKYDRMMKLIQSIIIRRLQFSTIPFELRNNVLEADIYIPNPVKEHSEVVAVQIDLYDDCPCASGKKFCECHGRNIRRNRKINRRR